MSKLRKADEGQAYFLEIRLMREIAASQNECQAFAITNLGYVPPSLTQAESNEVLRAAKMELFRISQRRLHSTHQKRSEP